MRIDMFVRKSLAVLALLLFVSTFATAQNSGDNGQYQILGARYGTAYNNIDVTKRLRELASQDRVFRMGNSTFGVDPDPGRVKILRIYARGPNGNTRTFEYREGSTVDGNLFTGWRGGNWGNGGWNGGWDGNPNNRRLTITKATYGSRGRSQDVTGRLSSYIRDGYIDITVSNSTMGGDPAYGDVKTLWVNYSVNGRSRQVRVNEGERLRIP